VASPFLVLLDRDGTINVEKPYLDTPDGLELMPGAVEGMKALSAAGAILCIVTNQSGVGRGHFDLDTAFAINNRLVDMLIAEGIEIAHVATCPHVPDDHCNCRKPRPGLALAIAEATGLSLEDAWVIGDKPSDVEMAVIMGGRGVLISDEAVADVATAKDLVEAAAIVVASE